MGANEKHAATTHGGEYTPSTDVVLAAYMECEKRHVRTPDEKAISAFDRWLDQVRAEAKAEALTDMAHVLEADIPGHTHENGQIIAGRHIIRIIRARANQYKEEQS
ncbi:hypothetical protein AOZ07_02910 [Glutamicibacter halophytocola]|uniref:hypothetical protein n=1 Tax=Glutamicibacter halophytocola TaxID=1933880 RepID=UPI0006D4AA52|nr:hypothetical protein [Glutamicibacter halophytocola]ALG28050.1 hypothetical protein AOZ07_02910 [Glutamicibacter halophytocola]